MHAIWMAVPILIWALHFGLVYGFTSLACARGLAAWVPWVIAAASVAAALAALGLLRHAHNRLDGFSAWMTAALTLTALVAIVYETTGAFTVPACR